MRLFSQQIVGIWDFSRLGGAHVVWESEHTCRTGAECALEGTKKVQVPCEYKSTRGGVGGEWQIQQFRAATPFGGRCSFVDHHTEHRSICQEFSVCFMNISRDMLAALEL